MARGFWKAFVSHDLAGRDVVVDVFRGLAVIGMILVNHPIPLRPPYAQLVHAAWHGWTFADTIYPAFLFIVGVAVALTTSRKAGAPDRLPPGFHGRIARRVILLFALNLLIFNFPVYAPATLNLTGVLAQIGWCYLLIAYLGACTTWRLQAALVLAVLLAQWALYTLVEVPGVGAGVMTREGNAQRYLEHLIFGDFAPHLYAAEGSIGGLVFTLSTTATALTGMLAGSWLRRVKEPATRAAGLFASGCVLALLGLLWGSVLPINKQLWTPSYVVLTTGISLQALALLYWVIDVRSMRRWITLPHVAGVNALVFYVFAWSLQRIVGYGRFTAADGSTVMFRHYLRDHWPGGQVGSLVFSLLYTGVCFALVGYLYRRRWYVKL